MEEFEVWEYVRTDKGLIDQIIGFDGAKMRFAKDSISAYTDVHDIVNHSFNIIDLIEVGDYVNGKLIHHTDIRKNSAYIYYGNGKTFVDYQIENVVTKEQFESVKYEVIK